MLPNVVSDHTCSSRYTWIRLVDENSALPAPGKCQLQRPIPTQVQMLSCQWTLWCYLPPVFDVTECQASINVSPCGHATRVTSLCGRAPPLVGVPPVPPPSVGVPSVPPPSVGVPPVPLPPVSNEGHSFIPSLTWCQVIVW
jgi:hypothetical protein